MQTRSSTSSTSESSRPSKIDSAINVQRSRSKKNALAKPLEHVVGAVWTFFGFLHGVGPFPLRQMKLAARPSVPSCAPANCKRLGATPEPIFNCFPSLSCLLFSINFYCTGHCIVCTQRGSHTRSQLADPPRAVAATSSSSSSFSSYRTLSPAAPPCRPAPRPLLPRPLSLFRLRPRTEFLGVKIMIGIIVIDPKCFALVTFAGGSLWRVRRRRLA